MAKRDGVDGVEAAKLRSTSVLNRELIDAGIVCVCAFGEAKVSALAGPEPVTNWSNMHKNSNAIGSLLPGGVIWHRERRDSTGRA